LLVYSQSLPYLRPASTSWTTNINYLMCFCIVLLLLSE
jgi:hypothetical protein